MENTSLVPTVQLTPFEQTKETLTALASDYKNMVVTKENLKEANEARLVLYRKRIEIQNVAKANRKTIKDFLKNNNDAIETELIEVIEPTELALEDKIKKIKDAIAEEERIERDRIEKHKGFLNAIKDKIVEATNSNNELHLKSLIETTVLADLEEFQAEGEQFLSTLKETAKNRLELLEFQAKKKADEEAEAKRIADEEKAQQALNEVQVAELAVMEDIGIAEMAFDADFEEQAIVYGEPPLTSIIKIAEASQKLSGNIEVAKLSPLKTVPIGAVSEQIPSGFMPKFKQEDDKDKLRSLSVWIKDVDIPNFSSDTAIKHGEYIQTILNKLSEQTLKVAEKL